MIRAMRNQVKKRSAGKRANGCRHRLSCELLEDRRMLSGFPSDFQFDTPEPTDFTIGFWMNSQNDQTTDVAIVSNKDWGSGSNPGFIFSQRGDGDIKLNLNTAGGSRVDSGWASLDAGEWHHIAASFNRTTGNVSLYINGTLAESLTQNAPGNQIDTWDASLWYDLNLGQDGTGNYGGGQSFKGLLDDVAIWRRELDADEIATIHDGGGDDEDLTAVIDANSSIGSDLVGLYPFEDNLLDSSPGINSDSSANDGLYRTTGVTPDGPGFNAGLFGQAVVLRDLNGDNRGDEYVTIGDAVAPDDGPDAFFTGATETDNNFSTGGNWDLDPSQWIQPSDPNFQNGTTVTVAANTSADDPAVLQDGDNVIVENLIAGGADEPVFIAATGGQLIGQGGANSRIGAGADVTLAMTGGEISHYGNREEGSELIFGGVAGDTSNVAVVMGEPESEDVPLISSGPFRGDATYATGYRRLVTSDELGPRWGDDIKLGIVDGDDVSLVMNGESMMVVVDVLYPMDQARGALNVTQNDDSEVNVLWDTRWIDSGGSTTDDVVSWTLNDDAKFRAARDHNMGERSGQGVITVDVDGPGAQFTAGDRIAIGSGGGNVTVNVRDGLMKVGGDDPADEILVDPTGEPGDDGPPRAVDWVLLMGSNAESSTLNLTGGRVEVGRSAFVGLSDGGTANAKVFVDGGVFEVKGVGPSDSAGGLNGIGNNTANGTSSVLGPWFDSGGDVTVGMSSNDEGEFRYRSGEVSIARDLNIGFGIDSGNEGTGTLVLEGRETLGSSNTFQVGGVLAFGYDFVFDSNAGSGAMDVVLNEHVTPVTLTDSNSATEDGNVYIGTDSEFSLTLASGYRPETGEDVAVIDLVDFTGERLGSAGEFVEVPARESIGIDYSLSYEDGAGKIQLELDRVYRPGDMNFDGVVNFQDLGIFSSNFGGTDRDWTTGDLNGDGVVNFQDLAIFSANFGKSGPEAPVASGDTVVGLAASDGSSPEKLHGNEGSSNLVKTGGSLVSFESEASSTFQLRSQARSSLRDSATAHDLAILEIQGATSSEVGADNGRGYHETRPSALADEADELSPLLSSDLVDELAGNLLG